MIYLKKMISHGRVRACYYHPEHTHLCVKVALSPKHVKLLQKELDNDALFQEKIGSYVPRYYQLIKTDKGIGLESDLIRDDDGKLSPRLLDYFTTHATLNKQLLQQFQDFFQRLFQYNLWFYDFNNENFLIQTKKGKEHLIFCDTKSFNRNNSWSFLKLEYMIPFLARIRMKRRVHRFYKSNSLPVPPIFT